MRSNSNKFLIVQLVAGLVFVVFVILDFEEKAYLQTAIAFLVPSAICLTISLIARKCKKTVSEKLTELIMPIELVTLAAFFLVVDLGWVFDEVDQDMRQQQYLIYYVIYFFTISLMGVSYLPQLITRCVLIFGFTVGIMTHRNRMGDVSQSAANSFFALGIILSQELALYINFKARAKLFIQNQMSQKQQEQLGELLNSVPDSVMICTKGDESRAPRPVYGNSHINRFFGHSVVKSAVYDASGKKRLRAVTSPYEKKSKRQSASEKAEQKQRERPLSRNVFRDMDAYHEKRADEFDNLLV